MSDPLPSGATRVKWASPWGSFDLLLSPEALLEIRFAGKAKVTEPPREVRSLYEKVTRQLSEYATGKRKRFDLPLAPWPSGTPFQKAVWEALCAIPYGEVAGYADLARWVGSPKAFRAVGQACGANRIPILIPCHRAVSKTGLGGFAGGLPLKKRLLSLERG